MDRCVRSISCLLTFVFTPFSQKRVMARLQLDLSWPLVVILGPVAMKRYAVSMSYMSSGVQSLSCFSWSSSCCWFPVCFCLMSWAFVQCITVVWTVIISANKLCPTPCLRAEDIRNGFYFFQGAVLEGFIYGHLFLDGWTCGGVDGGSPVFLSNYFGGVLKGFQCIMEMRNCMC